MASRLDERFSFFGVLKLGVKCPVSCACNGKYSVLEAKSDRILEDSCKDKLPKTQLLNDTGLRSFHSELKANP